MINGVRLSEIHQVSFNHLKHYRRVASVENSSFSGLSQQNDSFVKVVRNRKINHVYYYRLSNAGKSFNKIVNYKVYRIDYRFRKNKHQLLQ
jgi:hypothetical protein